MPPPGVKRSFKALNSAFEALKNQPTSKELLSRHQLESLNRLWSERKDRNLEMRQQVAKLDKILEARDNIGEIIKGTVSEEIRKVTVDAGQSKSFAEIVRKK